MALVEIQAGPFLVTAAITRDSVEELGLAAGVEATALVKATSVMVERSAKRRASSVAVRLKSTERGGREKDRIEKADCMDGGGLRGVDARSRGDHRARRQPAWRRRLGGARRLPAQRPRR